VVFLGTVHTTHGNARVRLSVVMDLIKN